MQGFSSLDRMKTAENVKRAAVGSTVSIRFDSIRSNENQVDSKDIRSAFLLPLRGIATAISRFESTVLQAVSTDNTAL